MAADGSTEASRAARRAALLARAGWGGAACAPLSSDASFRRYARLRRGGETALLMDAPPGREDAGAFARVAETLLALGLSAPRILAEDREAGFLLIEDFGEATFTRLLDGGAAPAPLYARAVDALAALHGQAEAGAAPVPFYDRDRLLAEAALLPGWYLPALTGRATSAEARAAWDAAWAAVLDALPPPAETLVLRDYHVDNLMLLEDRAGVAACGLLDFQDAVVGPAAYDLVSLLEDARRDVPEALAEAMLARYAAARPETSGEAFLRWYRVLGVQRHAKVAGIFVRLLVRDGKPRYLGHIPRVMRLLARGLEHPDLAPVARWFDRHLPEPEAPLPALEPERLRPLSGG
jgi:aminoglycoside/choline kinase family phosphotransferase